MDSIKSTPMLGRLTLLPSNRYTLTSYHTYCVIDEVHMVSQHPHIFCRAIHLPRVHHSRHVRMSEVKYHSNVCGIGYMPGERRIDIVRTRFASSTNQRIYMNMNTERHAMERSVSLLLPRCSGRMTNHGSLIIIPFSAPRSLSHSQFFLTYLMSCWSEEIFYPKKIKMSKSVREGK